MVYSILDQVSLRQNWVTTSLQYVKQKYVIKKIISYGCKIDHLHNNYEGEFIRIGCFHYSLNNIISDLELIINSFDEEISISF